MPPSEGSKYFRLSFPFWNLMIMKSVQFFQLIFWYFMFWIRILILWGKWINSGPIFYMSDSFFWAKSLQKCSSEITKKFFRRNLLKKFHFSTLWIWLFAIFDKRLQGCHEVKYSIRLLQGPRLMARTTKSPIRGNHWVPLGCRAHLGSVKWQIKNQKMKLCNCAIYQFHILWFQEPNHYLFQNNNLGQY